jgi:hypothetical protein
MTANVVRLRPLLTPADIFGRKMTNAIHIDVSRSESAWFGGVEGVPRLTVWDHRGRKGRTLKWAVDGKTVRNLEAALAVLNGEKTLEEAVSEAAEQEIPEHAQRPGKVSIEAQIAEIDYELQQRKSVYARIAASNPSKGRENELHVQRMQAVRATLVWLRDQEATIKQRMSY